MKSFLVITGLFLWGYQAVAAETAISTANNGGGLSCESSQVFIGKAVTYSSDSSFRCDYFQEQGVIQKAAESATMQCYAAGHDNCALKMSSLTINGYLGYQDGFDGYLGYGCMATAIVHGATDQP